MKSSKYAPSHKNLKSFTFFKIPYFTKKNQKTKNPLTELFFFFFHWISNHRVSDLLCPLFENTVEWQDLRQEISKCSSILRALWGKDNRFNHTFIWPCWMHTYSYIYWISLWKKGILMLSFFCVWSDQMGLSTVLLTFSKNQFCLCWLFSCVTSVF